MKFPFSCIFLAVALILTSCSRNNSSKNNKYGMSADKTDQWQQVGDKLLTNFINMYNLHIIHEPDDEAYPYKGWFFGWADNVCNAGAAGCDATYAARAKSLQGPWQVYSGDNKQGAPVWDTTMDPKRWVPVIAGGETNFDNWHNGDPSVVRKGGQYYMVYSATGHNKDGIAFGQPGDSDSDISVVMAATSFDGLHWTKSAAPILVYEPNIGQAPVEEGGYMHDRGLYHCPFLMFDEGKFKAWFDCYDGQYWTMLYAENSGDPMDSNDWQIVRDMENPALVNFPNPDVIKIDDLFIAFGDPGHTQGGETGWASRKLTWAVSLNGVDWKMVGHMKADAGWNANQVPETIVLEEGGDTWVYLSYGTMVNGHFHQDSVRMKRWKITQEELKQLRQYAK
jgi:hypothetical protein